MAAYCETENGPVAAAARDALESGEVERVLPFAPQVDESKIRALFADALEARSEGEAARRLVDRFFVEHIVRLHRIGEGAPYTGVKPARDPGRMVRTVEAALLEGDGSELTDLVLGEVRRELERRFETALTLKEGADIDRARRYVEARLGLVAWAQRLHDHAIGNKVPHRGL